MVVGDMGTEEINAERSAGSVTQSPELLSAARTGHREEEIMKSVGGAYAIKVDLGIYLLAGGREGSDRTKTGTV